MWADEFDLEVAGERKPQNIATLKICECIMLPFGIPYTKEAIHIDNLQPCNGLRHALARFRKVELFSPQERKPECEGKGGVLESRWGSPGWWSPGVSGVPEWLVVVVVVVVACREHLGRNRRQQTSAGSKLRPAPVPNKNLATRWTQSYGPTSVCREE